MSGVHQSGQPSMSAARAREEPNRIRRARSWFALIGWSRTQTRAFFLRRTPVHFSVNSLSFYRLNFAIIIHGQWYTYYIRSTTWIMVDPCHVATVASICVCKCVHHMSVWVSCRGYPWKRFFFELYTWTTWCIAMRKCWTSSCWRRWTSTPPCS
jgi:energy-coupling factor transporter transmembrane protein EcfT